MSNHTVTSDNGAPVTFDSGALGRAGTFSFTFPSPGTVNYHCVPHEGIGMIGTVIVIADTGVVPDAAPLEETAPPDSVFDAADSALADLESGTACPPVFAGCTSFVDATDPQADRTVTFQNYDYIPKCLAIRSGQTVAFKGNFYFHPLRTGCGPASVLDCRNTGVEDAGDNGVLAFTLTLPGLYGYYCLDHGSADGTVRMSAAINVLP
jgi:plastocyanin